MEELKELIGKIQVISDKPLESFIEFLEKGSEKFRDYISLLREIETRLKHLQNTEARLLETLQANRLAEEKKFNSEYVTHATELTKIKGEVIEQEKVKTKNADHIGALETQIDGLTQLYDKKKTEYDILVDKIADLKNPHPLSLLIGNAHEERYKPKP